MGESCSGEKDWLRCTCKKLNPILTFPSRYKALYMFRRSRECTPVLNGRYSHTIWASLGGYDNKPKLLTEIIEDSDLIES